VARLVAAAGRVARILGFAGGFGVPLGVAASAVAAPAARAFAWVRLP
jgi:hypothetical protein